MIKLIIDNVVQQVNFIEFSDGAITCKLDLPKQEPNKIVFSFDPSTPVKLYREQLVTVHSAVEERYPFNNISMELYLPYLPYGRADRVFEEGNPAPLKQFIKFINSFCFDCVTIVDIHNPSFPTILYNWKQKPQYDCVPESVSNLKDYDYIIAPDKGATLKACVLADSLNKRCLIADKTRNISTGKIELIDFPYSGIEDSRVLIVDDILDGGGTFIPLAEKLKSMGVSQVDLYVTHLIAAKGLNILKGYIDQLYYWHIVSYYINDQDVLNFNSNKGNS